MTIKDVESLVGITKKNIRFYERMQLLTPLRDRENSYRNYSDADVQRLKKVKLLRSLHMPIEEIRKILSGENELQACLQSHTAELCAEIDNLRCARQLCAEIERDISGEKPFCIDGYLGKLREYEKEGVKFMKRHTKKNNSSDTVRACHDNIYGSDDRSVCVGNNAAGQPSDSHCSCIYSHTRSNFGRCYNSFSAGNQGDKQRRNR
ncbi:MAG: MerR family transcriptional regulator [Oscillospiraceae bacterium]